MPVISHKYVLNYTAQEILNSSPKQLFILKGGRYKPVINAFTTWDEDENEVLRIFYIADVGGTVETDEQGSFLYPAVEYQDYKLDEDYPYYRD